MKTQIILVLALAACAFAAEKKADAVADDSKTVEKRGLIGLGYGGLGYGGVGYPYASYGGLGYGYGSVVAHPAPVSYSVPYAVAPRYYGGYPAYGHGIGYGYSGLGYNGLGYHGLY